MKVGERMKKYKTEIFIQKSIQIHGDKYNYDKVKYINSHTKVIITCPNHGDYTQLPTNHISGKNGCPICANRKIKTDKQFAESSNKVHGDRYDYSESVYVNNITKVKIICKIHGPFYQAPVKHINESCGCPLCGNISRAKSKTNSLEYFINKSKIKNGDKYDYSKVDYINNSTKVRIICPKHGEFMQSPDKHMAGQGCPKCKSSRGEKKILRYLENNKVYFKYQHKFDNCKNLMVLPFDFYLPKYNICIEYDGIQHVDKESFFYSDRLIENDSIKTKYCIDNNIKLIRIPYTEFKNIETILKKEIKKD